jgi:hypothetical protein
LCFFLFFFIFVFVAKNNGSTARNYFLHNIHIIDINIINIIFILLYFIYVLLFLATDGSATPPTHVRRKSAFGHVLMERQNSFSAKHRQQNENNVNINI